MPRLTKRLVDGLQPGAQDYFVWDAGLPGFGVRVFPSGHKSYLVQYRDAHGRTRRYRLGPHGLLTPDQARTQAHQALVRAGDDPQQVRQAARQALTVNQLVERFLTTQALRPATLRSYRGQLTRHLLPALGAHAVPAVTRADVQALHQRLRATPTQANRVLALCARLFQLAEDWGLREVGTNPARRIPRYPEVPRERYLSGPELARLGQALVWAEAHLVTGPETIALIRLLLLTGARWGEIRTLRWGWIDWDRATARLPESKTGAKTLYVSPDAQAVLQGLGRQAEGLVLPGRKAGQPRAHPHKVWRRICATAGLQGVRLHDLRHTYASMGATLGLSLQVVGRRLGHADAATTQRYAHLAPDPVRQAAQMVGEAIREALGG